MRAIPIAALFAPFLLAGSLVAARAAAPVPAPGPDWSFNATIIEACSCPMFCQCYFNTKPAAGPGCCAPDEKTGEPFCKFNNAFRVNRGSFGAVKLDGLKFWLGGDLGADLTKGVFNWAVVHFEPSASKEQREALTAILTHLYPVKWGSFTTGKDAPIAWEASRDHATARLDGGKLAEVVLKKNQGMTDDPIVIRNLRYWGAPRNDGFVLMANEVEAYRTGDKPYEYKGTNGFMITVDIESKDVAKSG